jgi:hypothetical protein
MTSRITSLLTAALVALSTPVIAQGAGGAGGSGAGGSASTSSAGTSATTGTAATTGGTQQPANQETSVSNSPNPSSAPAGSPTALQAQRNAGAGTAPNGVPIGNTGSGIGSPEQPVDSGTR